MARKPKEIKTDPLEVILWKAANKLRKNIDIAEYKHIVLGFTFLKYISDSFESRCELLRANRNEFAGADPEDKDGYIAYNIFFVPELACWDYLISEARLPGIDKLVDDAMELIKADNPQPKGVLPRVYTRQNFDATVLGKPIDLIGNIVLGDAKARSADVLDHVFEYPLGEFALAEGKQGGQFYTSKSIISLLVNVLEPYKGRVFDLYCGSGGVFIQSGKFVETHRGDIDSISIYGQKSSQTTWRLAKMNLAIRSINSEHVRWNGEGLFLNDTHKDLKPDFIITDPSLNVSDWSGKQLHDDVRWQYGILPTGNVNSAWMQYFLYHLSSKGQAGVVLAREALTSRSSGESDIRVALVKDANAIDCIANLPAKPFPDTRIPTALWFMCHDRENNSQYHDHNKGVLFIGARNLGHLINHRTKVLSDDGIRTIADTYHNWRNKGGDHGDVVSFCASVDINEVAKLDYVLTPGCYVGFTDEEDDFDFEERFTALKAELEAQLKEEVRLNNTTAESLAKVVL